MSNISAPEYEDFMRHMIEQSVNDQWIIRELVKERDHYKELAEEPTREPLTVDDLPTQAEVGVMYYKAIKAAEKAGLIRGE